MVVTLDKIDMAILRELLRNCRASYRAIARKTGLSPNAARNRVAKLTETAIITRFVVKLKTKAAGAGWFLGLVLTDGTEDIQDFLSRIGENPMVFNVTELVCVSGGRYIVGGEHPSHTMLDEYEAFLKDLNEVQDVEFHTIQSTQCGHGCTAEFSRVQLRVLKCLMHDARMQVSEIAERTGMASKTIRRALKELIEGGDIRFTLGFGPAVGDMVDIFVRITWDDEMISEDELIEWLWSEYPDEFWVPWTSESEAVVFAAFIVDSLLDAQRIAHQIRGTPFVMSSTLLVALTCAKFPSYSEMKLKEILDDSGV
ncbi:MAG: winged helix-turn-helix transcriptional regulator [Candidatus Thorarchaeota archaeon]|jgi:DNA-binding Lrp family transcriptional regulator